MNPLRLAAAALRRFALAFLTVAGVAAADTASLAIRADQTGPTINPNLYGQFAEHLGHGIYGGVWVGENSPIPNVRGMRLDVIGALRHLHVPVVRWPGGCFADEYHWQDGIGPRNKRPRMINTHWGGLTEDNAFGTHEFMDFCSLIGAQPYICGNVGSGTVREMMDWVEYMTSDADSPMANLRRSNGRAQAWVLPFFGVGNECWGCGGNMRPEYYADEFRRYNTFVKNYGGHQIYRIACGSSDDDANWTDTVMRIAGKHLDGISLHHYSRPISTWKGSKGSGTQFGEDQYFSTLQQAWLAETYVALHSGIIDKYDPEKRVGLLVDEWGVWTDPEPGTNPGFLYQQNTLRDAIAAAVQLHIFQQHADRVVMANIAQMVNVLQAMVLTDGPRMLLTPTYHVFEMLNVHQGATALPLALATPHYRFGSAEVPAVSASASRDRAGRVHVSLVNADPHRAIAVACSVVGQSFGQVEGRILTAGSVTAHNTFEQPNVLTPQPFTGVTASEGSLRITLPPASVVILTL